MIELFHKMLGIKPVNPMTDTSPKLTLNSVDWKKIGIHVLVVSGSAALIFLGEFVSKVDLGQYGVILLPMISTGITTMLKFLKDNDQGV